MHIKGPFFLLSIILQHDKWFFKDKKEVRYDSSKTNQYIKFKCGTSHHHRKLLDQNRKKWNKKNHNTNTRCNNQNYSATQNPGFVPQPITQEWIELLQQSVKLLPLVQPGWQWHCPPANIKSFSFLSCLYFHNSTRHSKIKKVSFYHNISNNLVISVKKPTNLTLHETILF